MQGRSVPSFFFTKKRVEGYLHWLVLKWPWAEPPAEGGNIALSSPVPSREYAVRTRKCAGHAL